MGIYKDPNFILVRRHIITIIRKFVKILFFLILLCLFYFFTFTYKNNIGQEFITWFILPIILIVVTYIILDIALIFLHYYSELMIIKDNKVIMIRSSLFFTDDVETIDAYKITKIDSFAEGFFANVLGYGSIVIELQKDNVRIFHYVSNPHEILTYLNNQKDKLLLNKNFSDNNFNT